MAYELVEEVLDHAPADLNPTDILVLVAIAEEARRGTRMADIPAERLARRARIGEDGLRRAMQRLESRGIKVRVPIRIDKKGRPLYAIPGRTCSYLLPVFEAPEGCLCHRCEKAVPESLLQTKEGLQSLPPGLQSREAGPQSRPHSTGVPPNQSGDPFGVSPDHAAPPSRAPQGRDDVAAAKQWARQRIAEAQQKNKKNVHRREGNAIAALNQAVLRIVPPPEPEALPA